MSPLVSAQPVDLPYWTESLLPLQDSTIARNADSLSYSDKDSSTSGSPSVIRVVGLAEKCGE